MMATAAAVAVGRTGQRVRCGGGGRSGENNGQLAGAGMEDVYSGLARPSAYVYATQLRGGNIADKPGPTDYSSTLKDQSRPWWREDKNTHRFVSAPPKSGGGFFEERDSGSVREVVEGNKGWIAILLLVGHRSLLALTVNILSLPRSVAAGFFNASVGVASGGGGGGGSSSSSTSSTKKKASPEPNKPRVAVTATAAARARAKPFPRAASAVPKASKSKVRHSAAAAISAGPVARSSKAVTKPKSLSSAGGSLNGFAQALIPEKPWMRAVGILTLAVLGNGGLYKLNESGMLNAAWFIPFVDPWQLLTALAYALNQKATFLGGRLDGRSLAGNKNSPPPVRFFSPAGWAFVIWAPIFFGELLFVIFQLLPLPSVRGSWWLSEISPWFAAAMIFQTLWCLSYRPWARDGGFLWIPALMLGGTAVTLGGAHAVLREAWFARDMEFPQYVAAHLPLSLHFGWISCAALVNLNGYFATRPRQSNLMGLILSVLSIIVAVLLGTLVTLAREDPVYAAVVAWALWAVGDKGGWGNLQGRVDPGVLRVQEVAAKTGSVLAIAAAAVPLVLALKDMVTGIGADSTYNEDY